MYNIKTEQQMDILCEIMPKTSYKQNKHNAVSKHPVFILTNIKIITYKLLKRDIIKICNEARTPSTYIKILSSALSVALNSERRWKVSYVKVPIVGGSNLFHPTNYTSL